MSGSQWDLAFRSLSHSLHASLSFDRINRGVWIIKVCLSSYLEDSVIYFRLMHNLKTVSSKTLLWVFSCPQETKLRNQVSFIRPRNNHPSWHLTPRRHRKWDLFIGSVVSSREQWEEMVILINSSITLMILLRKRVQDTKVCVHKTPKNKGIFTVMT